MTSSTRRIHGPLGVPRPLALVLLGSVLVGVAGIVAAGVRYNLLPLMVGAAGFAFLLLMSVRWPRIPALLYAALIPLEEALVFGEFGTLTRYASLLIILAYGAPRLGRIPMRMLPAPAWLFIGWAILSIGWALDPAKTIAALPLLLTYFITALCVAAMVVEYPGTGRMLLWTYSLSAAAMGLLGVLSALGSGIGSGPGGRVSALADWDPAYYAAVLAVGLLFAVHELMRRRMVLLSAFVVMSCGAGVLVSGTRSVWLSLMVVGVFLLLSRLGGARRVLGVVAAGVLVVSLFQLPGIGDYLTDRASTALSSGGAGRTDIWAVGVTIFSGSPVVGVGLSNFPTAYTPERVRESAVGLMSRIDPENIERAPHSIVIGTLGELGIVGFTLLVLFLVPVLLKAARSPTAEAAQVALAGLLVTALFLDVLFRKELWLLIGVISGLLFLRRLESAQVRQPASPATDFQRRYVRATAHDE